MRRNNRDTKSNRNIKRKQKTNKTQERTHYTTTEQPKKNKNDIMK